MTDDREKKRPPREPKPSLIHDPNTGKWVRSAHIVGG
jgi:hypothetical protein